MSVVRVLCAMAAIALLAGCGPVAPSASPAAKAVAAETPSARLGVHVQTILKLESGTPTTSLATMLLVLRALGMSADIDALAADDPLA